MKLGQYKDSLKPSEIKDGINAAIKNAKRLLDDANILFNEGRYPTATSIAIHAIEEAGKVSILRELALAKDGKNLKNSWRSYRSHTKKNASWLLPELFSKGARKLDDFAELFSEKAEHTYLLDNIKQLGFYTDCLGKKNWSMPEDVIDKELAESILKTASIFCKNKEVSVKEIELWVKHLSPVWMVNNEWMKKALQNWYKEMQENGLYPGGENAMKKFISSGIE
jgi:AbiV family abortive infection protein